MNDSLLRKVLNAWPAWLALALWVLAMLLVVQPWLVAFIERWYSVPADAVTAAAAETLRHERLQTVTRLAWLVGAVPVLVIFLAEGWLARRRPASAASIDVTIVRAAVSGSVEDEALRIGPEGRYRVERLLATGGMGSVHKGYDTKLHRAVAIKEMDILLAGDPEQSRRFHQEALALAALAHPGIVPVYDLVEDQQRFWIVMELLPGGDLEQRIERERLSPAEAIRIIRAMADALAYAHERGIVHRDIKPMNILFNADGMPKLVDFGVAKLAQSGQATGLTQEGMSLGSPTYMSPEQALGSKDIDARSDIYALGATFYKLLAGTPPFTGDVREVMLQHINAQPLSLRAQNPAVSESLEVVVMKMLAKSRDDRYANMQELIRALDAVAA